MSINVVGQFSQNIGVISSIADSNVAPMTKPSSKCLGGMAMIQMHTFGAWQLIANFAMSRFRSRGSHIVSPSTQIILFSLFVLGSPAFILLQILFSVGEISSRITLLLTELAIGISSVFARSVPIELIARFYFPASGASFHEVN